MPTNQKPPIVFEPIELALKNDEAFLTEYEGIWESNGVRGGNGEAIVTGNGIVFINFSGGLFSAQLDSIAKSEEGYIGELLWTDRSADQEEEHSLHRVTISPNPYKLIISVDEEANDERLAGITWTFDRQVPNRKLFIDEFKGVSFDAEILSNINANFRVKDDGTLIIDIEGCKLEGLARNAPTILGVLEISVQPEPDNLMCTALDIGVDISASYGLLKYDGTDSLSFIYSQSQQLFTVSIDY